MIARSGGRSSRCRTTRLDAPGARSRARRASSASRPRRRRLAAVEAAGLRDARVVCVITGHGLKDPDAV